MPMCVVCESVPMLDKGKCVCCRLEEAERERDEARAVVATIMKVCKVSYQEIAALMADMHTEGK